jgi:hypothetical protein
MMRIRLWQTLLSMVVTTSFKLFLKYLKVGSTNALISFLNFFSILALALILAGSLSIQESKRRQYPWPVAHVDHAAPTHSSRRGHRQVLDLEHHRHMRRQRQNLATIQAQLLIIVKHSIHGLDP